MIFVKTIGEIKKEKQKRLNELFWNEVLWNMKAF